MHVREILSSELIPTQGIMEMREALAEKEDRQNLKSKMREKVPKCS